MDLSSGRFDRLYGMKSLRFLDIQEPDYEEKKVLEHFLEIFLEIQF